MIGRVPGLSPRMGDVYYLRMLLYRVRRPHSSKDSRTYEGVLHPTFKAACQARSMLANDQVWDSVMTGAIQVQMPAQLRHLFACLLVHCELPDPAGLFERIYVGLSEDITHRLSERQAQGLDPDATAADVRRYVLLQIDQRFLEMERRLSDFPLPLPPATTDEEGGEIHQFGEAAPVVGGNPATRQREQALAKELAANRQALLEMVSAREPALQPHQRAAWEAVRDALIADQGDRIFLDAPGGCGKTYVAEMLQSYCRG